MQAVLLTQVVLLRQTVLLSQAVLAYAGSNAVALLPVGNEPHPKSIRHLPKKHAFVEAKRCPGKGKT